MKKEVYYTTKDEVIEAIKRNASALQCASDELMADEDFLVDVLLQCMDVIKIMTDTQKEAVQCSLVNKLAAKVEDSEVLI